MRAARSASEMAAGPVGRYFAGESFVVWCWSDRLFGTTIWGKPDPSAIDSLLVCWRLYARLSPSGYSVITDARRLEQFDPTHYPRVLAFAQEHRDAFEAHLTRHALVLGESLPGFATSGLYSIAGVQRFERFADLQAAFTFAAPTLRSAALPAVEQVVATVSHESPTLAKLRALLRAGDPALAVDDAADRVGLSTRGLQRALSEAGTTYRGETDRARVELACQLLETTDLKIETIAHRVGCSQTSGLARLFARMTGEQPSTYRARRQGSRA